MVLGSLSPSQSHKPRSKVVVVAAAVAAGVGGEEKKKKRCVFVCERRKGEAHRRAGLRRRRCERGKGEEGRNRGGQGRGKGGEYGGGEGRGEGVKPHQSMKYRPQKNRQTKKKLFSL